MEDPVAEPPCAAAPEVAADGPLYGFVVDRVDVAGTAMEAERLGLDLDCDADGRPDNALGRLLALIDDMAGDLDVGAETNAMIESGAMLHLIEVRAPDLDGAGPAAVLFEHGVDLDGDPSDNFSGVEVFEVDPARPAGSLAGHLAGGGLSVASGTIYVAVAFPGRDEPFVLPLIGARIEATITRGGIEGRLAGGVPAEVVDEQLVPAFREGLNRIVARDCAGGCAPDSFGALLLEMFDADRDGTIGYAELRDDPVTEALLAPDVDLRDADGNLAPGGDGVADALSVGFGFTAVPAFVRSAR
ncbi:MAG: hypothetical protein D6689_04170 [Deltaproteobacteria bacterium]|nr:MAG: hypothetical protein D6689_04170 [Deltaproteobacteria bacterium]